MSPYVSACAPFDEMVTSRDLARGKVRLTLNVTHAGIKDYLGGAANGKATRGQVARTGGLVIESVANERLRAHAGDRSSASALKLANE